MDMIWLAELPEGLEQSWLGEVVRATPHLYPILEGVHIVGIALLVGAALAVDLRLLGIGRHVLPVSLVTCYLLPLSRIGFAVVAATGALMFMGNATAVVASPAAPWKLGLIGLAAINILIFHTGVYRTVSAWDLKSPTPLQAKAAALVSAATWTGVVIAGRFLAY